jgi:hypothetical protein
VDGHRRDVADAVDPVDVRRRERDGLPAAQPAADGAAEAEALLHQLAADHRERAPRDVVVVEPGVVVLAGPADQPDLDALVAPQHLEHPLAGVVADALGPQARGAREPLDQRAQAVLGEGRAAHGGVGQGEVRGHAGTSTGARSRAPFTARAWARGSGPAGGGATTGRSEPWTSASAPTTAAIAAIAAGP